MMGLAAVGMTPNPGSPWADLVDGVSGRRRGRRAGVHLGVMPTMIETTARERRGRASASGSAVHRERRATGGGEEPRRGVGGEILAERKATAMTAVTATTAVESAAIETGGMSVNTEPHRESTTMTEVLGAVEATINARIGRGKGRENESVTLLLTERRGGALTKKTLAAPRTKRMMMAGPRSAAEPGPVQGLWGGGISR